jgi:UDP-N-acetylmuramyl pentapeptide phosphotransferase/UDP-N-acetylglucosamine-1-phosphate transferase
VTENRRGLIQREAPAQTPEEARQRRSRAMVAFGGFALAWGLVVTVLGAKSGTPAVGLVLLLAGAVLLVGGLVVRR